MISMMGVKRAGAAMLALAMIAAMAPADAQVSNGAKAKPPAVTNNATTSGKVACTKRIEDTVWTGRAVWKDGDTYDWTLTFRKDGVLAYSYRGSNYDNGAWFQRGTRVDFSMNNHYADYTGRLSGDTISGTQKNSVKNTGTWKVTRSCVGGIS